ncbi:MAG: bifunctional diguanylate cyclase/phosphodiesterase [Nitrosomonadales bacterium]|nr:MAG: bifunctional diguanylate cyclase/phosphodiesterase [Nitrosomonadales bacterium]
MTWKFPRNPTHPALQLARMLEDMGEAVLVANREGLVIYAGRAAKQLFGVSIDDSSERPLSAWLPQVDDLDMDIGAGDAASSSGKFEVMAAMDNPVRARRFDGSEFLASLAACRTEIDGEMLQIFLVRDLSDIRRVQEQMIDAQRLVRSILHNTSEGFVLIDPSGIVLDTNPALVAMFGLTEFDLMESRFERHLDETARELMTDLLGKLEHGRAASAEFIIHRRDGTQVFALFKGAPLFDAHNERVGVFGLITDITESRESARHIEDLAFFDQVTGLANRAQLEDKLNQAIQLARRNQRKFAVIFLDLDHFKHVNDSLTHLIGDQVLQTVAQRIQSVVRESDVVARFGGDEFVIGLIEPRKIEDAAVVAQKLLEAVAEPVEIGEHTLHLTTSIGISVFPDDADTVDLLIRAADLAMYQAKASGRNRFGYYTAELNDRVRHVRELERHMRLALQREEFVLHYQAKVDTNSGCIVGAEALIRWHSAELGFVSPADFIPLAEETGLMLPIGTWVLRHACEQISRWQTEGLAVVPIAVNISGVQLRHADFMANLKAQLLTSSLSSSLVELEITESMLMDDAEAAMILLQNLRELGFRLSIDDFGTGYSSFSYLTRLPISTLKIDRSFVLDLPDQANAAAVASAIIGMAKNLALKTVAEGVETPEQAAYLKQQGCDQIQGYLFSKPLPADDFAVLLREAKVFNVG